MTEDPRTARAAFYARRGGRWADGWTLLHPPYTLWHLSYPVIGAALSPALDWRALGATVLAFFLAVGVAAHALDELHGRPLGTAISDRTLVALATSGLVGAAGLGALGVAQSGPRLVPFIVVGVALVLGYNLELWGGRMHTELVFAAGWGGFPVVVGFLAQAPTLSGASTLAVVAATAGAIALASAQRKLSTPARQIRRRLRDVTGMLIYDDDTTCQIRPRTLLAPLEGSLGALAWAVPLFALALVLARVARV